MYKTHTQTYRGNMANKSDGASDAANTSVNKGAWTADEDRILAQYVEIHGAKRWKSVAVHSGLNRCGKSCRLRWLNYLRPDIKRGNISDAEDDLILRLHRLLGNRWSLIARRLPGRTDNEIKNYWNAHLRKKARLMEKLPAFSTATGQIHWNRGSSSEAETREIDALSSGDGDDQLSCDGEDEYFFDASAQGRKPKGLEWVKSFLELEEEDL